jgi:hypothetical protein
VAYTKDALLAMAAADPRLIRAGELPALFEVTQAAGRDVEVASWFGGFAGSVDAVTAMPDDVVWQPVDGATNVGSDVLVTAHGRRVSVSRTAPVVVREVL